MVGGEDETGLLSSAEVVSTLDGVTCSSLTDFIKPLQGMFATFSPQYLPLMCGGEADGAMEKGCFYYDKSQVSGWNLEVEMSEARAHAAGVEVK